MKRKTLLVTAAVLTVCAMTALEARAGWGRRGCAPGCGPAVAQDSRIGWDELTRDQRVRMNELRLQFLRETTDARNAVRLKSLELETLLLKDNPNEKQALQLQQEIFDLRATVAGKRLMYQIKARALLSDAQVSRLPPGCVPGFGGPGCGPGRGRGNGSPCW